MGIINKRWYYDGGIAILLKHYHQCGILPIQKKIHIESSKKIVDLWKEVQRKIKETLEWLDGDHKDDVESVYMIGVCLFCVFVIGNSSVCDCPHNSGPYSMTACPG